MNFGKIDFVVTPNMRIAQIIVAPITKAIFTLVEERELAVSERGHSGFGHSGIH
jgi:dUTP pyrophosphatase